MATKTNDASLPVLAGADATCPECRVNQVEAPFDYCSMCEMLTSYYQEKVASTEQRRDAGLFHAAFEKWRGNLTWAEIQSLRDTYWTPRRRALKARAAR
jgi:hypothetical protein